MDGQRRRHSSLPLDYDQSKSPADPIRMRWVWFVPALGLLIATAHATTLNRGNGGEPASLDPHFVGSTFEINIVGDLMVGLTTLDAAGRPVRGMADRWKVSSDGITWTFHLRKA